MRLRACQLPSWLIVELVDEEKDSLRDHLHSRAGTVRALVRVKDRIKCHVVLNAQFTLELYKLAATRDSGQCRTESHRRDKINTHPRFWYGSDHERARRPKRERKSERVICPFTPVASCDPSFEVCLMN